MRSSTASALIYALIFAATGVSLPYAGLWFDGQGLSGSEISVILAAPMLARAFTGPLVAVWADSFQLRRTAISWLALIAAVAYGACALVDGFALWLVLWFVAATAAASLIPLSDALTLKLARRDGFVFSIPRGVGSVAFIVANVAMGVLLRSGDVDRIVLWVVLASVLLAAAALLAPAEPVQENDAVEAGPRLAGLGYLMSDRRFMIVVVAISLIQASHAFYYGFSSIIWRAGGISTRDVGLLWGFSVVVEVALMWGLEPWRRRLGVGPIPVLILGAGAAIIRWLALAMEPPLAWLWPLQALHALSFAAVYLAAIQLIERLAPADKATAAQMVYSSLSAGLLIGLATVVSGPLYDLYGPGGYLAMSGLAALGLGLVITVRRRVAVS
ncbi:MFS transporter [Brevundimonas aveniformis]|uniref:MFS transporter n=1 Tax=Brevundimonas aveniformis TaxID=370977 RepID=UPI002492A013|nr:MFS transporter [Brevundimonas aveniformis]